MDGHYAAPEGKAVIKHNGEGMLTAYAGETYYGLPPVKRSIYGWAIGASYFLIGLAGASQVLSTLLDFLDVPDKKPMVRAGRYAALAGSLLTPLLYIYELGTPRKWYNMLRIYRPTSLMSIGGVWFLTAFGASSGGVALGQVLEDFGYEKAGNVSAKIFSVPAAMTGAVMSTYMGTELEETSTPLWAEASPMLSSLFALNSASSALALFELTAVLSDTAEEGSRPVRFLAMLSEAAEIVQLRMIEKKWTVPSGTTELYRSRYGLLYRTGLVMLGKAVGLIMRAADFIGGTRFRGLRPVAALATLTTCCLLPSIILSQGNKSADRPEDYFEYTSPVPMKQAGGQQASNITGKKPGTPKMLGIFKSLVIGALAAGTVAMIMRPKKAY